MTHASTPRSAVTTACRSTDLVLKDRPKSRKVSKIRTVSNIHRTTRLEPPTEDTTSNTAVAVEEEQAQPEPAVPAQAVQPPVPARGRSRHPWPYGSGMPGFGAYRGKQWHDSDSEEQDEHDDPSRQATTSNAQEDPVPPIARTPKRYREAEARSNTELPELIKDDDKEHRGTGKMSSEPKSSEST
jgi:hypothetical protein